MPEDISSVRPKLTGQDFLLRLAPDFQEASEIHDELERLVTAFVKKRLREMFGGYQDFEVTEIVDETFLIVYRNFSLEKPLDFSNPPESLQSYFWRIAQNICRGYRRGKYRAAGLASLTEVSPKGVERENAFLTENPESDFELKELDRMQVECQRQALGKLRRQSPDDFRLLIDYTHEAGRTPQAMKAFRSEMAAEMNVTTKYLAILIYRIREKVRDDYRKCLSAKGLADD